MTIREFICAMCGQHCLTTTTEAEANREFLDSGMPTGGSLHSVCDECYKVAMTRARELGLLNE